MSENLRAYSSMFPSCPISWGHSLAQCLPPQTKVCDPGFHCVMAENNCTSYPCMASPICIREFRRPALKRLLLYRFILSLDLFDFCCSTIHSRYRYFFARCTRCFQISRFPFSLLSWKITACCFKKTEMILSCPIERRSRFQISIGYFDSRQGCLMKDQRQK